MEKKIGVGIGVMILRNGKVLLGKRHDDPEKAQSALHGEGTWTMPGGKINFRESFEDCAFREVLEETGVKIDKEKLEIVCVNNDVVEDAHFVTVGFLSKDFEGEPKVLEPEEITKWEWFSLKELPKPIFFASKKILKEYFKKLES